MKTLIKIFCFFYLFVLLSCSNGVNIEIINDSKIDVKKIAIKTGFSTHTLDTLKINETKTIFIPFNNKEVRFDGIMGLSIYKNNITTSSDYNFGYYSNGIPPEDMKIIIKDDTVLFQHKNQ